MYKEHYRDMFKKGILRDSIVLDAIHENNDINMEIKFIVNSLATELRGIKPVKIDIPIIHIIIDYFNQNFVFGASFVIGVMWF